ncbi:Centrosomal protein [Chionoecetes opilio]|uniref:Centrosomal protein n=1 Tax=Chionoecetes opilio TaxID=41210 RepID=A0A8J4YR81_CHIOP|nr:Centrosomal protein [Chionoecetes opilio]
MAVRASAECVGESLTRHYRLSCELFDTYPLPCFTHQLSQNRLCLTLHTIDRDHLEALCHTLKNKVSPSALTLTSGKAVDAGLAERAVEGVGVCLVASLSLASLSLEGVRLRGRTLRLLCEGVRKARTLKTLLIRNCTLGDSGTESVCQAVKNVPSITHLLLVNCGVTERGGTAVASPAVEQRQRHVAGHPQAATALLDAMRGLRRLSLNGNPALGDTGVTDIAQALTEDLWIKAVDLQHCGVGVDGGVACRALLHINHTLEVVDLRDNPFLPEVTAGEVTSLLQGRDSQGSSQYGWLKTSEEVGEEAAEDHQKEGYRGSGRVVRGRRGQPYPHIPTRRPKLPSQLGVPWRVEHRLYERREGLAPGSMVRQGGGEGQGGGEASEPAKDSGPEGEANLKKMRKLISQCTDPTLRKKLEHYKKKYRREREHRQKVERKLSRIHSQLQGLHTLDDSTLNHIEECFLKFHILLSMMQNTGEQEQSSSSGTVSPLHHPSAELGGNQAHPETVHPPSTVPVPPVPPIIHQPLNASTSLNHVISASSPHDSRQGGDMETVKADNSRQRGDMETVKADNSKQRGDMETETADNSRQRGDMETVKADNSRQRGDMETDESR